MSRTGATDVVDLSGNGKGVALNMESAGTFQNYTTAARTATIIPNGRVVFDLNTNKLYIGNGLTLGGNLITSA